MSISPSNSPSASPSAAPSPKGFSFTFLGKGTSQQLLIKPGDTIQAYIELTGTVVAAVRLEYTTDGGHRWVTEEDPSGDAMIYSGSLSSLVCQEFIKNESAKDKVYRWRCTSYTSGTLTCYMNKQDLVAKKFRIGDDLFIVWDDEAPLSGIDGDGAGYAGHGSLYIDTSTTGGFYRNQGTKTLANWTSV